MRRLFKDKSGLTLLEMIAAVLLLSVVFLAVSSLYVASQKFYITATQRVTAGYEVQYAIQHIYKNAMMGIGDINLPAIPDPAGGDTLTIRISENDPLTAANYNTNVKIYRYRKNGNALEFDIDGAAPESLIPKVTVTEVNFTKNGNALIGYIKAYYTDPTHILTFYFGCYPRLATFN
jgi:prepilin-type N-terminal cleavage/methylation domain-containing protein